MTSRGALVLLILAWLARQAAAQAPGQSIERRAWQAEQSGRIADAVDLYRRVPRMEYHAVELAREHPEQFLLKQPSTPVEWLFQGDMKLILGDPQAALTCYRQATVGMQDYVALPPPTKRDARQGAAWAPPGPGSHRDNWVLRRFLALKAFPEAEAEFDRVWQLHRAGARDRGQFNGLGLLFAADYVSFLQRSERWEAAGEVLLEPLETMDLDHNPDLGILLRPDGRMLFSRRAYLRMTFRWFASYGKARLLDERLMAQVRAGRNPALRLLACLRVWQQRPADAVAFETAFLQAASIDEASCACRLGFLYQDLGCWAQEVEQYRKALASPWTALNLPDPDVDAPMDGWSDLGDWRSYPRCREERALKDYLWQRVGLGCVSRTDRPGYLESLLRRLECNAQSKESAASLQNAQDAFAACGESLRFREWCRSFALRAPPWLQPELYQRGGNPAAAGRVRAAIEAREKAERRKEVEQKLRRNPRDPRALMLRMQQQGRADSLEFLELAVETGEQSPSALLERLEKEGREERLRQWGHRLLSRDTKWTDGDLELLLAHADPALLDHMIRKLPVDSTARRQALRIREGGLARQAPTLSYGWSGLPDGLSLLASSRGASCLASDERYLYTGNPWGITVYDHRGQPVTRVALGSPVQDLAVHSGALWAATPAGLFRIQPGDWSVALLPLGSARGQLGAGTESVPAEGLLATPDALWVTTPSALQRLEPSTLTLTVSCADVPVDSYAGRPTVLGPMLRVGGEIWVECSEGTVCYDPASDRWEAPASLRDVKLAGWAGGTLWGQAVWPPGVHRPCRINPGPRTVDRLQRREDLPPWPGELLGLSDGGAAVFEKVEVLDSGAVVARQQGPAPVVDSSSVVVPGPARRLKLPDGSLLEARPWDVLLNGADISNRPARDALPREIEQTVACGSLTAVRDRFGVALLDRGRVLAWLDHSNGLPDGAPRDMVELAGKLYVSNGHGLSVIDLRTSCVRTLRGIPADGTLRRAGDRLYILSQGSIWSYPPGVQEAGPALPDAYRSPGQYPSLAWLGGSQSGQLCQNGTQILWGARGVVLWSGEGPPPAPRWLTLEPQIHLTRSSLEVADSLKVSDSSCKDPDQVRQGLSSPNPLVVRETLKQLHADADPQLVSMLTPVLSHPDRTLRVRAVQRLGHVSGPASTEALQLALADDDQQVHDLAAWFLADRGQKPDHDTFARLVASSPSWSLCRLSVPEDLPLWMEAPPDTLKDDRCRQRLGALLLASPEMADQLLSTRNLPEQWFHHLLFQAAGSGMLPTLHRLLQDPDPVRRANAAQLCGALGDPRSIPPLMAALDRERGYTRATVVRSLGRMHARPALPALRRLYTEREGENPQAAYQNWILTRLDEPDPHDPSLPASTNPNPVGKQESIPSSVILDAIREIDPTACEELDCAQTQDPNPRARSEAAAGLAQSGAGSERAVLTLQSLLADPDPGVRKTAGVSLLLLGQPGAEDLLLGWLRDPQQRGLTLYALEQVPPARLEFARQELQRLAPVDYHARNLLLRLR